MNGLRISRPPDTAAVQHPADPAGLGSGATFVSAGVSDFARWFAPLKPELARWRWVLHAEPGVFRFPDDWYRDWDEAAGAFASLELRAAARLVLDERDDWRLVDGRYLERVANTLLDDWADFFALSEPADRLDGFLERWWAADTPEAAHALIEETCALHFSCVDGAVWEVHAADDKVLDAVRGHAAALPGVTVTDSTLMQSLRRYEPHG
ncbi:MAG TPA: hypothetical protein VLK66_08250 [Longimicrobium sp.]|nr:hypothetical protein [Longimicrobium sp.]